MKINVELKVRLSMNMVEIVSNIPQEDLYYIMDLFNNGNIGDLELIGRGSYGNVYGYKDYALKFLRRETNENRDIEVLKDLKHLDCIPTLYATIDDRLIIMERVYGMTVRDYCYNEQDKNNYLKIDDDFVKKWNEVLVKVIKEGYSPDDLHESNVMIDFKTVTPKLVDVGFFTKHRRNYERFDIETVSLNRGYSTAEMWTGKALRNYIKKEHKKKIIEKLHNVAI